VAKPTTRKDFFVAMNKPGGESTCHETRELVGVANNVDFEDARAVGYKRDHRIELAVEIAQQPGSPLTSTKR